MTSKLWTPRDPEPVVAEPARRKFLLRAATVALAGAGAVHWSGFARTRADEVLGDLALNTIFPATSGPGKFVEALGKQLAHNSSGAKFSITPITQEAISTLANTRHQLFVLSNSDVVAPGFGQRTATSEAAARLRPVMPLMVNPFFIMVGGKSPWQSLGQLMEHARTNPGAVRYGSWGPKTLGRIYGARLARATGTQMVHVAYANLGDLYKALAQGEIDWALGTGIGPAAAAYKSGAIRPVAIADQSRDPSYDVPTIKESLGLNNMNFRAWLGLFADAKASTHALSEIQKKVISAMSAELRSQYPSIPAAGQMTAAVLQDYVRHERFIQHG